jgi:hypothetical protein
MALNIDHLGAVHHDFVDRVIFQERLDRAEAEDFGGYRFKEAGAVDAGKYDAFSVKDFAEDLLDLAANFIGASEVELGIELCDQLVLYAVLELKEALACGGHTGAHLIIRTTEAAGAAGKNA